jgi:hypothetical protein
MNAFMLLPLVLALIVNAVRGKAPPRTNPPRYSSGECLAGINLPCILPLGGLVSLLCAGLRKYCCSDLNGFSAAPGMSKDSQRGWILQFF